MTNNRNRILSFALMTASPLALVLAATPAVAQERAYDIKAQPLSSAIIDYGRQSGVTVVAPIELMKGKTAPAVRGNMTPSEALDRLLSGSGLRAVQRPNGAITVVQVGNASGGGQSAVEAARGQGAIVGRVFSAETDKNLPGVIVRLAPNGPSVKTDEQGEFRILNVPVGVARVEALSLGFGARVEDVRLEAGETARVDFPLGQGQEIVVYGRRSARNIALNQERTGENSSTVISEDALGNFQGTTLSEALRRAPGVSFIQNDATGDGTNVIVRGLSPDYNQVTLNGLALVDSSGFGRSANLANILADSVSGIKISKTLLPNQDSAGTGGLVEIETKSPLDRPRRYVSVSAEGTLRSKGYGQDYLLSATASGKFGASNQFGLSASYQFRKQDVTTYAYDIPTQGGGLPGAYLPLDQFGNPMNLSDIDPRAPFPFEGGHSGFFVRSLSANIVDVKAETTTVTLTGEWQVSDATNLRFDYLRSDRTASNLTRSYSLNMPTFYGLTPIPELGGETRYSIRNTGTVSANLRATLEDDVKDITQSASFRGKTQQGPLELRYGAGFVRANARQPFSGNLNLAVPSFSFAGLTPPEAIDPATGRVLTIFGARSGRDFPLPLLTDAGYAALNATDGTIFQGYNVSEGSSSYTRTTNADVSAKYEFASPVLKYVEVGLEYKKLKAAYAFAENSYFFPNGTVNGRDLGLDFSDGAFERITGRPQTLRFLTPASFRNLRSNAAGYVSDGTLVAQEEGAVALNGLGSTNETELVGYFQTRLDLGKLEIISGARINRVDVKAVTPAYTYFYDEDFNFDQELFDSSLRLTEARGRQTNILPRIVANYRPNDLIVFRAGYYKTVARPQVNLLSASPNITLVLAPFNGPNFDRPILDISNGNPDLKPASTDNFDIGGEYYDRTLGVIKLNVFYKRIKNLLESNRTALTSIDGFELPDDPRFQNLPSNIFIQYSEPTNNPAPATIWGFEAAIERQLDFLPGVLSGLGVYLNYTYSKSSKDQPYFWFSKPVYDAQGNIVDRVQENIVFENVPFEQSPPHSGTAGLTYNKGGFEGTLFYTMQSRRRPGSVIDFNLVAFNEAYSSLDVRAEYGFKLGGAKARVFVSGSNLLKSGSDADIERSLGGTGDTPKYHIGGFYRGGRTVTFGLSSSF